VLGHLSYQHWPARISDKVAVCGYSDVEYREHGHHDARDSGKLLEPTPDFEVCGSWSFHGVDSHRQVELTLTTFGFYIFVQLGAADFLQKPLSDEKLRNIWQHVVRKVRRETFGAS
jgi:hypothetical protein